MKKRLLAGFLAMCLLLGGCSADRGNSSSSDSEEVSQSSGMNESSEAEEPTEEDLIELFDKAMYDIEMLAMDIPSDVLYYDVFDKDIEFDYEDQVIIDGFPYIRTSRQYSEVEDYYAKTFTDKSLDWILSTKFADINGGLYCSVAGGATVVLGKAVSVERLEGNTYQGKYQDYYGETDITFSIQKTDVGYRISSIDYCPDLLNPEWLKEH